MMTTLEIEDAILVARRVVLLGRAPTLTEAELLARALLTIAGSPGGPPTWIEPADLWLDRFRAWDRGGFWAEEWGPQPFFEWSRAPVGLLEAFLREKMQQKGPDKAKKPPADAESASKRPDKRSRASPSAATGAAEPRRRPGLPRKGAGKPVEAAD